MQVLPLPSELFPLRCITQSHIFKIGIVRACGCLRLILFGDEGAEMISFKTLYISSSEEKCTACPSILFICRQIQRLTSGSGLRWRKNLFSHHVTHSVVMSRQQESMQTSNCVHFQCQKMDLGMKGWHQPYLLSLGMYQAA